MNQSRCKNLPLITHQLTNMWDRSSELWFVKDREFRLIYANRVFMKVNKLPKDFDVIGYSEKELLTPFCRFAHLFEEHDRKVFKHMQRISAIGIYRVGKGKQFRSYFYNKFPLMDENNQCIGVASHVREIEYFAISHYIKHHTFIPVKFSPPNDILKEKEWMIIYLFCCGISNKDIAVEMKMSCRTVEKHFEIIYEKLSVGSAMELRCLCKEKAYDLYVPPRYYKLIGYFLLNQPL
ncbi:helix-turn-helix transcriptional regulator [Photorhabdus khanii]|uniref:Helix-turn-helix transcriptional regulator n=2 Tax=Photorhabdus khanii TaxID=1004150 RepID=A0A4R4IX15_9GAMM|nr:PAS domain-containing protein [Photorhabdus khanii]ETS32022.1 response regulator containing a CheY-like receiver [Photorhabdus khanii NC19]TDB45366.1 helix-turn-helix transcriptional regulator [Photorhabdus khanii subsp. guanajuatensis]